jgi:hypothetical protein
VSVFKLVTQKSFTYRGAAEEYANIYHFSGTQPADQASWQSFADAVKDLERPILPATVTFTTWLGYNDGSETADFTGAHTGTLTGTFSMTGLIQCPGDDALWVRWATGDRSSQGKPIFLRKYFHPAVTSSTGGDTTAATWRTAAATYGAALTAGGLAGTAKICRPNGHLGSTVLACTNVTTRTLKRRGRRPS